jgi:hypothetical protein
MIVYFGVVLFQVKVEMAHFSGLHFPRLKFCINFDINVLGYVLGDFFANSSGHPDPD